MTEDLIIIPVFMDKNSPYIKEKARRITDTYNKRVLVTDDITKIKLIPTSTQLYIPNEDKNFVWELNRLGYKVKYYSDLDSELDNFINNYWN